ncbi:SPOR domain-containing protein, partial [Laribacter hongkongensis]
KPVPASHPAEPVAAHAAETKAESRQVCLRLQHLDDASAQTLKTHFDKRKFRYRDLAEPVEARPGSKYWVYLPTSEGREAANQKSADLKARGFDNYVVSNDGAFRNALSLGLFSQESGARTLASKLAAAGIKGVQVQQRGAPAPRHTLRLARLSAQEADAVRQMARQAGSGIEVDEVSCHK